MMPGGAGPERYRVVITNLTAGQPLSPPLLVAHAGSMHVWQQGAMASPELRMLAEQGMNADLAAALKGKATDVVAAGKDDVIMPGQSKTMTITANPGDVLSVAAMVGATNDGFAGVDGLRLGSGTTERMANAYDAGTEQNTERKSDTPDPVMGKGHVPTDPPAPIGPHAGIRGGGDLDPATFGWTGPVAKIVVTKQ